MEQAGLSMTAKIQRDKPECYHAVIQYSCDICCNCKHDKDCYEHFLNFMLKNKQS